MKRRSFLKFSSAASLPVIIGGFPISANAFGRMNSLINNDSDKVLVLVQLQGGNDGLNTVIPLDKLDILRSHRNNIMMPDTSLISVANERAFHPTMTGMKQMWDNSKLQVVQSVGYVNQNRSHFRSTDIWNSGSSAEEFITTGWLGRYFDLDHLGYPTNYPNAQCPDPFAITVGTIVSETCQGFGPNYSLALTDPDNPGDFGSNIAGDLPPNCYGDELAYIQEIARQGNAYGDVISTASDNGNTLSSKYDEDNILARKLRLVAQLISGGLQTKVYVVQLGGFDTHSDQVEEEVTTDGIHGGLLSNLSEALCAFQDDLELLGISDRVMGMTYSEFGRRIKSNDSLGTDHGSAAPLFLFGDCVVPQFVGTNDVVPDLVDEQTGVPMQFDFRNIYGTILTDWFGAEESDVRSVLFDEFTRLPLLNDCADVVLAHSDITLTAKPDQDKIVLNWGIQQSAEFEEIQLERSVGDVGNFEKIKQWSYKEVFNLGFNDLVIDSQVEINQTYYYRLILRSEFQDPSYSNIASAKLNGIAAIELSPNPVTDKLRVNINGEISSLIGLQVYDAASRQVKSLSIKEVQLSGSQIVLDCVDLTPGLYMLRVNTGVNQKVLKFVKL